jgi:hypothetical protein
MDLLLTAFLDLGFETLLSLALETAGLARQEVLESAQFRFRKADSTE